MSYIGDVTFNGFTWPDVTMEQYVYGDGNMALVLMNQEGPIADVTVNVPDQSLPEGAEFWVKDYSENYGMADALATVGAIVRVGGSSTLGPFGARIIPARLA